MPKQRKPEKYAAPAATAEQMILAVRATQRDRSIVERALRDLGLLGSEVRERGSKYELGPQRAIRRRGTETAGHTAK